MTKSIVFLLLGVGLAASLVAGPPVPAPASANALQQARQSALKAVTMAYQKIGSEQGVAAGLADPITKRVWLTAINATSGPDYAEAGFRTTAAVSVTSAMPGATVKATFNVQSLSDQVTLKLYVGDITDPGPAGHTMTTVSSANPSVQLTTNSFTLLPGKSYVVTAVALVRPDAPPDKAAHAVVKLTDLKWEF